MNKFTLFLTILFLNTGLHAQSLNIISEPSSNITIYKKIIIDNSNNDNEINEDDDEDNEKEYKLGEKCNIKYINNTEIGVSQSILNSISYCKAKQIAVNANKYISDLHFSLWCKNSFEKKLDSNHKDYYLLTKKNILQKDKQNMADILALDAASVSIDKYNECEDKICLTWDNLKNELAPALSLNQFVIIKEKNCTGILADIKILTGRAAGMKYPIIIGQGSCSGKIFPNISIDNFSPNPDDYAFWVTNIEMLINTTLSDKYRYLSKRLH